MKKKKMRLIIFLLILFISIGFAYLSTNLFLRGTGIFSANSWDIYFDNVVEETYKTDIVSAATISNKVTINASINLNQPKSTYTMYADIVNDGSLDAMLDSWNVTTDMTSAESDVIDISLSYADGTSLTKNDLLESGSVDAIVVNVVYKDNISNSQLLTSDGDLNITITFNYVQADEDAVQRIDTDIMVTYDYNDQFVFTASNQYLDTGYQLDWNTDFNVDEVVDFGSAITNRYLFFGNYNNSNRDTVNAELLGGKTRIYFRTDSTKREYKSDDILTDTTDVSALFSWNASTNTYSFTVSDDNETITISNNIGVTLGTDVGSNIRIGTADYRNGAAVFTTGLTYKSFKISRSSDKNVVYYLPTPVRSGYTFDGWYIDKNLTSEVESTDKVSRNITLYAKWIAS